MAAVRSLGWVHKRKDEGEERDEENRWRWKLLAEGKERRVGILMFAPRFKWS